MDGGAISVTAVERESIYGNRGFESNGGSLKYCG